ncbi:MAG: glycosyltransferase [Proteobacteria bacterium]|nr:glycosyltransferase [Pseudomonadota bacterium]
MSGRRLTVVQLLPALNAGGVERSTLEIGAALAAAGHRSVVISAGGRLVERLTAQGSEHIALDIGRKSPLTLRHVRTLRRRFANLVPDIVHARSRLPAWLAWRALGKMSAPRPHFLTTVHGLNSPGWYSSILTRGERVICVSNTVRDHVLKYYPQVDPGRLTVIPRGVDPDEFPFGHSPDEAWRAAFAAQFPQLAGGLLLTLPGRGTRIKGHADAIELLAGLVQRGLDCKLLLLGADERGRERYLRELRALATRRGVAERVAISAPRDDVRDIYAVSNLVLQLSTKPEAFGRTVVEAIALCRPVLGYAHGGVGELLAELYPEGRVPPGDITRLIERAAELLRLAPPIAPLRQFRLADMQAAALDLYSQIVG